MDPPSFSHTPLNTLNPSLNQPNFISIDPNSLCLHPYFPTPHELAIFKVQAINHQQTIDSRTNKDANNVKCEFPLKFEGKHEYIPESTKVEPSEQELSSRDSFTAPSSIEHSLSKTDLKSEVEKLIRFLFSSMGKANEALVGEARGFYLQNSCLLEVYDKISTKYYYAKKCKEDLIRYILRKIFRHLRTSIMKKEKVNSKKASLLLSKKYFQQQNTESSEVEDEEKLLESLMPYNKNSKNKTMNISFILEIFSSPSFCKEYQDFLPRLNTLISEENKKKEKKLVSFIMDCIEKNCMEKLSTLQRLPWLDVWMEDARNLAVAIMPNKRLIYNSKKPKTI